MRRTYTEAAQTEEDLEELITYAARQAEAFGRGFMCISVKCSDSPDECFHAEITTWDLT